MNIKTNIVFFSSLLVSVAACAVESRAPADAEHGGNQMVAESERVEEQAEALGLSSGQAPAELKCRNVSRRWQICGDANRKKLVLGVGIRFMHLDPSDRLTAVGGVHPTCAGALADSAVPSSVRAAAAPQCGRVFAASVGSLTETPAGSVRPLLVDGVGKVLAPASLSPEKERELQRAVGDVVSRKPDAVAIGCMIDGGGISCWAAGHMCAAWIDEDGLGGQCWKCEIADCG